ncbi:SDR family oxidoreductase [Nocardia brasiliensis]|uniref:Short chain dehydrogenase n=1 Tax=Nocardia brasiliensis (strain ATCC 700358 / HUJEG-1) TaxID=1133849 RepID=K0FEB9_NOCB7|nr:SDR family oxidoreductase [Nocardia brasiliensis]AFU06076.1 short chain dehydrogenase [Nocardia brasiliensis ATCC 700358]OCF88717.1 short-chain dehydrogenase [Nocardia brasiliensis]
MAEKHVVRNGEVDIAVYEQGNPDGPTVLLLHGWPDSHRLWDSVVPELTERFRVLRVDNRGHGASTNPPGSKAISTTNLAADYVAVIEALGNGAPVHVLAHDWGSVATWEIVCGPDAQRLIASFTSVSGPHIAHVAQWARRRLARPTPRNIALPLAQLGSFAYSTFLALPVLPQAAIKLGMSEERWRAALSAAEGAAPEQIHLAPSFTTDMANGLRIYRSTWAANPFRNREQFTSVPTQIIVGTRDPAVRQSSYADEDRWAEQVWLRVVKGGHWLPFSHPRLLAAATVELIDTVTGAPPARTLRRSRIGVPRKPFEDQLVVITGGGSGIGRATALAFARAGAEIVVSDVNDIAAEATVALIAQAGGQGHAYELDVSDESAVRKHADSVLREHGVPDVLINNAGIGQAGRFLDTPSAEFDRVLAVNLHGVVNGCRAFAGAMAERGAGGHIVNLSSMAAYTPQQAFSAYSTSKAAVFMFSDCLRAELAGSGIGVSTICPGIVHTDIVRNTRMSGVSAAEEQRRQQRYDRLYRLRGYKPAKVADQIVRAVRQQRDVVPVTPEARLQYVFGRVAPALVRFAAARTSLVR